MPEMPDQAAPAAAPAWPAAALTLETALSAAAVPAAAASSTAAGRQAPHALSRWMYRPWGLRAALWLLLAIGLLPSLAGTAWYLQQLHQLALRDAFAQADLMANVTSESLRWQVQDAQAMLASVAARPKVRALDAADCDPVFRDFQAVAPAHKALALRRSNGDSVCSELPNPPSGANVAAAPWFQAALQRGGFHVSGVHLGAVQQTWTVRLTQPVLGLSGQRDGLLVSPLDLQQLHRRLFARLPPLARVAVVDGGNMVVLQSQQQQLRVGKPAAETLAREIDLLRRQAAEPGADAVVRQVVETGFDGTLRLFVLRPVPLTDWMVVASLPEAETLQGYRDNRNRVLAAVLLVLLGVAVAAWRVGRSILQPMRGLKDAARGVAAGDDSRRAPEAGPREIATVAHEFNRMVLANSLARAQLHASERHYRTLLQNLPVAVVTHRPDGAIEVFNDRACSLLRMSPAQLHGRAALDHGWHLVDAQGRRLAPQAYPVRRLLQTRQPLQPTLLGIVSEAGDAPAGGERAPHTWAMVTGYPQFDNPGELQRVIVVFVDVTAQREAEALRLAKESAEAASKAKSVFLSRVSHELRTPLNAINGFSELVLMDEQVPPASKDKLRHVLNAGQHLLALINQVLDLTRVESAEPAAALQPVALWPLLQECVALCGPLAQARGVVLALPPPPPEPSWVLGALTPLRQVLINLLSNAIKYNRPDGLVDIRCTLADDGGTLQLHIRDTGPGLSAAQQAALFQPFNRLGAEFSTVEGHGLGLSIARTLAQSLGGDITLHSVPGQGATFTLQLQRCTPP
jgi:signal transduction histidine kinase